MLKSGPNANIMAWNCSKMSGKHFFCSLPQIILVLCLSKLISCEYDDDYFQPVNINITFLQQVFKNLIEPQSPIILLLDDQETDIEPAVRSVLVSMDHAGGVTYGYTPNLKERHLKRGTIGSTDTVSFSWTFICLIEEKKSKQNAANYLKALQRGGNGRNDRFILLGYNINLAPFVRVSVARFKNIIGVGVDRRENRVFQRLKGCKKLSKLTAGQIENVEWHELGSMIGLHGVHFRISGTKVPPYLDIFYDYKDGILDNSTTNGKKLMGVNYQIFYQGSKAYNYTFEFNPPKEWTGKLLVNGTWDGGNVFADLINERADIASVTIQTEKRNPYADFVGPFGRAHLIFVTAYPENFLGKYAILRSYTKDVWLIIFVYFVIMVGLLCQAIRNSMLSVERSGTHYGNSNARETNGVVRILSKAWFIVWGISFEQTVERSSIGIKVVVMIWVYFILVVGTGFKSNLAAKISFPQAEFRPKTFKELANSPDYQVYFDMNADSHAFFQESTNPSIQKLRGRAVSSFNTTQCVISAFLEPKAVCIGWEYTLKIALAESLSVSQIKYPVSFSTEPAWSTWYTFALAKNSRYAQSFQAIGQHFFEAGLTHFYRLRLVQNYRSGGLNWTNHNKDSSEYRKLMKIRRDKGQNDKKPFKVGNFQLLFLLWFIGLAISTGRFLWEMYEGREKLKSGKRRMQLHRLSLHPTGVGINETPVFEVQHEIIPVEFVP